MVDAIISEGSVVTSPTSGAREVGVVLFPSTDERASLGRESELMAWTKQHASPDIHLTREKG